MSAKQDVPQATSETDGILSQVINGRLPFVLTGSM